MKTAVLILQSLFCLCSFATNLLFVNDSDSDAVLKLALTRADGFQRILAPARTSTEASIDNLLLRTQDPLSELSIIASVGRNPSTDTFCYPSLLANDVRGRALEVIYSKGHCRVRD